MKLLFSLLVIAVSFGASARDNCEPEMQNAQSSELYYPGGRGKRGKRGEKRINKKRKRKCHQFGRRIYAG